MISIFANDVIFLKEANGVVSLKANSCHLCKGANGVVSLKGANGLISLKAKGVISLGHTHRQRETFLVLLVYTSNGPILCMGFCSFKDVLAKLL